MLLFATIYAKHARHRSTCLSQSDMLLVLNKRDKYIEERDAERVPDRAMKVVKC